MTEVIPDTEWALRGYLRAQLGSTVKVWLDKPKGTPAFPMVVIVGRIGGGPDPYVPVDAPRISLEVWGSPGGDGRKTARDTMSALVDVLHRLEGEALDAGTVAYGASDIKVVWMPDRSDPDNVIPRYVVDATVFVRSS